VPYTYLLSHNCRSIHNRAHDWKIFKYSVYVDKVLNLHLKNENGRNATCKNTTIYGEDE